jgi:hypothetical protein
MPASHRDFLPTALGTCALVTGFGIANDLALVHVAPEHFTFFHPHYFPFPQPWAVALCFGLVLAGLPGLAWGILLYWSGHYGPGTRIGTRPALRGVLAVLLLTAAASWGLGWHVHLTGEPFYPRFFYPTDEKRLFITQTVELTTDIVGILGAFAWLLAIALYRKLRA